MRTIDVPQADNLDLVRAVVQAVADGHMTPADVGNVVGASKRHASYRLVAARVLDLLAATDEGYAVTRRGERLLKTAPGSEPERKALFTAVAECDVVQTVAPDLLGEEDIDRDALGKRIAKTTGLAESTAGRRATALLAWRRRLVLPTQGDLFSGKRSKRTSAQAPEAQQREPGPLRLVRARIARFGPLESAEVCFEGPTAVTGPLGSGKSSLLDALAFVAEAFDSGVAAALRARGAEPVREIVYRRADAPFGITVELSVPEDLRPSDDLDLARYDLAIGANVDGIGGIVREALHLLPAAAATSDELPETPPASWEPVLRRDARGTTIVRPERGGAESNERVGGDVPALQAAALQADRFPAALRIRALLRDGIRRISPQPASVRSRALEGPCEAVHPDGGNLIDVLSWLREHRPSRLRQWTERVTALLPGIERVTLSSTGGGALTVTYRDGLTVPARRLSDTTLRTFILATLPAIAPREGILLVDGPEEGLPPSLAMGVCEPLLASDGPVCLVATRLEELAELAATRRVDLGR